MKLHKKTSFFTVLALFTLIVLAACGSTNEEETNAEGTSASDESSYTVEHAMGTTEISGTPEKVVILTNEGTEALLSMGVKPVGAVESWLGDPWYNHISEDMQGVEVVGVESEINLEKIASLKPDLIIGNKMRQEDMYSKLSQIAPTVFSETLRGDWQENFKLYAKALNREDKGEEVLNDFDAHVEKVRKSLGDKVNQEISVVRFMAGTTRIYWKDSFSGIILEQIGFNRVEEQKKLFDEDNKMGVFAVEVGKELIPEMDGDHIFHFTYAPDGDKEALATEEEWTTNPLWKKLSAVQEGNVKKVDDAIWNTAGGVIAANKMLEDIEEYFK
ncbi:iron-siderophore ABC transporter substrate-binding protein [Halobacillus shinanisalinarum]|uniref:Iron-siderophore ABC transporter substrate-binding protein n=1 Tax=Halobacillus shinanisalinarum TaxID=2932258 RepID=A0ABY4H208_9BACI|nr:iron-siderophore ABC transporter substrate-binding protein [Halobacillus shinanisalinarum]UOQ94374.1 iron-siderophore ABC transporter substrate-binding protein [Halobacillus shinanisalinarum]